MGKQRRAHCGDYDKPMTLQSPTDTNTQGTVTQAWSAVAELWCSLEPLQGREYYDARMVQSQVTHIIRTWYRGDVSPTSKMRLVFGDRTFHVESVIDVGESHLQFEFRVVEQV